MSMEIFANHIIAVAQKNNMSITNLQLQKVMYFVLKDAKAKKLLTDAQLKKIYDEHFQVWAYGPVIRGQYDRFRNFGSSPIIGVFKEDDSLGVLNQKILEYLGKNIFNLVRESHKAKFWEENKPVSGFRTDVEYGLDDL